MRNSFSWRHALALLLTLCLLSLVAGAILAQDEPAAEPSDAIVIPSADNVSQSMTVDQYTVASGVLNPQGMTATSLLPSGTYASEQIPAFQWTADLGDTEQFFFYLYDGMVTDNGEIVKGSTVLNQQLIYPLTPTCAVSGSTADCSLTTTVDFADGYAYYWFVTSEAIDEVYTDPWDDPTIAGYLSYDDAVTFNLDSVLLPQSGSSFEFWATAGDRVTAVAQANVGVQVTITGPDTLTGGFTATDAGDGTADGTATITDYLITVTGRYYVSVTGTGTATLSLDEFATTGNVQSAVPAKVIFPEDATQVAYGDSLSGIFPFSGNSLVGNIPGFGTTTASFFMFDGTAGDNVVVTTTGLSNAVFDPDGNLLSLGLDGIANALGALPTTGTYYIVAAVPSNPGPEVGAFTLLLEGAAAPITNDTLPTNPNPIAYGQEVIGYSPEDVFFSFQAVAGDDIEVDLTFNDGVFAHLYDSSWNEVATGDPMFYTVPALGGGTYYIYLERSNEFGAGYVFELDNQNTQGQPNQQYTLGLDTTIAAAGFVIDVPQVYPDNEDVLSTTPIFTWPAVDNVSWYEYATLLPETGDVTWYAFGPSVDTTIGSTDYAAICANGQCRVRPTDPIAYFMDTEVQLWVRAYGPDTAGYPFIFTDDTDFDGWRKISDFTVVAPQVYVDSDGAEFNDFEGRPYFAARDQSNGTATDTTTPMLVEDMYGVLRAFQPDYYRIYIMGDNGVISDQWWEGPGGLNIYDGYQDTLPNGNYSFYAQGYETTHNAFTVWSAPDTFDVSETPPDSNDFVFDGIYNSLEPQGNDNVYDVDGNLSGLTATWAPCATNTDGKPECTTGRPFFHFLTDVDDYSGDWIGLAIQDGNGAVVFSSWFNRYTGEKYEFGVLLEDQDQTDEGSFFDYYDPFYPQPDWTPPGPYYTNSFWYCDTNIAGLGGDSSCVVQPRGLESFLMSGADYTVSVAGYHIGGFSGYTTPGDVRTDPNGVTEFSIAGPAAPSGLMVDVVGAPLTTTWENFPKYLTNTFISGEPKISWDYVGDATWYEIAIVGSSGVVYDEWLQPNVEENFGDYTWWPGVSDGWDQTVWNVNNQNPIASETTEGLWCRANDTSNDSPSPLDVFKNYDFGTGNSGDSDFMDLGDTTDVWTFLGIRGQNVNIFVNAGDLDPLLRLMDPSGNEIFNDLDASATPGFAQLDDPSQAGNFVTLPSTGIYEIWVQKAAGTEGTYSLTKNVLNNITGGTSSALAATGDSEVWLQPLTMGQVIDVSIGSATDDADVTVVVESFDGTALSTVNVQDADPAADVVFDQETDEFVTVPESSIYRVVVTNNGAGAVNYTVAINTVGVDVTGIGGSGLEFSGAGIGPSSYDANNLQVDGESVFTFSGLAGEVLDITFSNATNGIDLVAKVLAPDGTEIASNDNGGEVVGDSATDGLPFLRLVELPVDGLYRIVVTNKTFVGGNFDMNMVPKHDIAGDGFFDGYCGFSIEEQQQFDSFIGANGDYTAYVRYFDGGLSDFAQVDFTLANAAAQAPEVADDVMNVYNAENLTGTTRPIFQWSHIDGNTWYAVNVSGPNQFAWTSDWVRASDICDYEFLNDGKDMLDGTGFGSDDVYSIVCDLELNYEDDTNVPFTLAGDYQWTVSAFSPASLTTVDTSGTPATFTVVSDPVTAPSPIWPPATLTDTDMVTLTYTNRLPIIFEPGNNASWYFIYVGRVEDSGGSTTYFAPTIANWYYLPLDNTQKDQFPQDTYADAGWDQTFQNEYDDVCQTAMESHFDYNVDLDLTDGSWVWDYDAVPGAFWAKDSALFGETINAGATGTYTFNAEPGHEVTISVTSGLVDVSIQLVDPDGNVVASDDDGGTGTNSLLWQVVLEKQGVYSVIVTNKDGAIQATDVNITVTVDTHGIYYRNQGTRFYTGQKANGENTYLYLLDGEQYCYFAPVIDYVDENGEDDSVAVEFTENGTYEWWMAPYGPSSTSIEFTEMGRFNLEIPAPDPLYTLFEPVYGELAAKSSETHTVYVPASENLSYTVRNMGFGDNSSRLEIEVFAPGDVRGQDNAIQVNTLGGGDTSFNNNFYAAEGGIYTIVITNQDALDTALYSLSFNWIGNSVWANEVNILNWFSPSLPSGADTGDGTVVDGRLNTISWAPGGANRYNSGDDSVNTNGAAALWYKVEIIDTSTGDTIFDQWISREDAGCDLFYYPVSNYFQECQMQVPGDLFNPYGVFEVQIAVWGQGSDISEGAPYWGAVLPSDNPDTSINEGVPVVFTKL